jgi:hypothetical protein
MPRLGDVHRFDLFLGQAEAPFPLLVNFQGLEKVLLPEIRPQGVGDVEFSPTSKCW